MKSGTTLDMSLIIVYKLVKVIRPPKTIGDLCFLLVEEKWHLSALEGLAAVVNRVTCFAPVPGSTLYVHACHPRGALPAPGLAGCPVDRGE